MEVVCLQTAQKEKIATMAKMAVYDKKGFERDAEANQYFRHDYIYKRNMQMRFYVGVGCLILAFFYVMYLMAVDGQDILALNFQAELIRIITFGLVVMIGYSFLGTIIFTREFLVAQKRVESYFALMRKLNGEPEPTPERNNQNLDSAQKSKLFARKQVKPEPIADEDEDEPFEPYRRDEGYRYSSAPRQQNNQKPKR